uniref:Major facilitator superfamily (MFS) profile domain-containing protein n=1 Tax=Phytophthora ramorum TaxID=164328 RepID=H3GN75_PHYRM
MAEAGDLLVHVRQRLDALTHDDPSPLLLSSLQASPFVSRRRQSLLSSWLRCAGLTPFYVRLVLLLGTGWLLAMVGIFTFLYALPAAQEDIVLTSTAQVILLLGVYFLGGAAGCLSFGACADHFGRRPVLLSAMSFWLVVNALTAGAWNYASFVTLRLLAGAGIGGQLALLATMALEYAPTRTRGKLTVLTVSIAGLGVFGGVGYGQLAGAAMGEGGLGWRATYGVLSAFALLFVAVLYLALEESPKYLASVGRMEQALHVLEKIETAHGINRQARVTVPTSLYEPPSQRPQDVTYPSSVTLSSMDLTGVFTTTVFWGNTLSQEFWLESAESTAAVSWNLFPSTSFFVDDSASSSLPAAPIVRLGNSSTPLWTLQGVTPERLDMALNFRSTDDNATLVKVEVAVRLHTSGDAASTVTSIARPASVSSSATSALNVVVRHQSRLLRNGATDKVSKLLLYLEFGIADVTEKSADGCAHCQQLLDWCTNESGCAALKTCVLSAVQSPVSQLVNATSTASETEDLHSLFSGCLTGPAAAPVDVNALMLFTSAIRCQLQRLCGMQSPSTSIVIPSGIKLVWGSGKGQHRVQPLSGAGTFPNPTSTPVNISVAIGTRVVCYVPLWNNATAASVKTTISRSCTFAKYLGTVTAVVNANTTGALSVDLYYDGLVGPMPTLTVVAGDAQTQAVGATITTVTTPTVRVRYVSASGPVPYAATTDPTPTETCAECKRLALDVCLRDAKCAAMADCVMQYQTSTTVTVATDSSTSSTPLADAILKLARVWM